jgi:transcriptional regulatory protein GAL4
MSPSSEVDSGLGTMPDTAPSGAQGYDWTEETSLDHLADGMAALRIEPTGAGYLGGCFAKSFWRQV